MARAMIPNALRELAGGAACVEVEAQNVRALLAELDARFPGFRATLGENFAVAIDGEVVPEPLLERVTKASEVHFLPAVAGG